MAATTIRQGFERLTGILGKSRGPVVGGVPLLLAFGAGTVALFLGLFLSAQAGVLALAAAWLAWAVWRFPQESFFLLIFFAPLLPILKATQDLSTLTPLKDVVIAVLFLRTTIVPILTKEDPYRRNTLLLPVLLLVLWAFVGMLRADHAVLGLLRFRDLVLYLPLLWTARVLIRSPEDLQQFLRILVASAAVTVGLAAVQFVAFPDGMVLRFDPVREVWLPRFSGTLAHPNLLASALVFFAPLLLSLVPGALAPKGERLRWLALGAGCVVISYFTFSRSGWIALAAALVALAVFVRQWRRWQIVVGGVALAGLLALAVAALPQARTLVRTITDPTYASNQERLEILASIVASSTHTSVLVGNGLGDVITGTLREVEISLADIAAADVRHVQVAKARTFVDNAVLKTWLELGLVGLGLLAWITWAVLRLSWRCARRPVGDGGRALARGLFATTVGLVALSFFLDVPEIFPVALLWWAFVGAVQALPYLQGTGDREQGTA